MISCSFLGRETSPNIPWKWWVQFFVRFHRKWRLFLFSDLGEAWTLMIMGGWEARWLLYSPGTRMLCHSLDFGELFLLQCGSHPPASLSSATLSLSFLSSCEVQSLESCLFLSQRLWSKNSLRARGQGHHNEIPKKKQEIFLSYRFGDWKTLSRSCWDRLC